METIKHRLSELLLTCVDAENLAYFLDKAHFVHDVYFTYGDYDGVYENISRWQVMRVWSKEKELIDKNELGQEKYAAIMALLDDAQGSI